MTTNQPPVAPGSKIKFYRETDVTVENRHETAGGVGAQTDIYIQGAHRAKKREEKEMGHPRSQHFVLYSRDIEIVTRREGRWGFSKVYPWNGQIQT